MPKVKKTSTSQNTSATFNIPNKVHRQAHNIRIKSALAAAKRKEKFDRKKVEAKDPSLRETRLSTNLPDTIERKRVWDERIPGAVPTTTTAGTADEAKAEGVTGEEAAAEAAEEAAAAAEIAAHEENQATLAEDAETAALFPTLDRPPGAPPRILLTTSRFNHTHDQAEELANLFPNTTYLPRNNDLGIVEMAKIAAKPTTIDPATGEVRKPYSHIMIANVESKLIDALTIIVLPEGPTFRFTVSNYQPAKRISGHGRPTSHIPELILNNFLTPLGKTTAGLFQSLFPQQPQFQGRQVVTLHNQRDFIFFRRHRYVFREKRETEKEAGFGLDPTKADGGKGMEGLGVRVGLQEIGPRFTLKLRRVERGVKKDTVFQWKGGMDKVRTKFQL
ncbi:Brix domain-containing protein [Tricharina praecox]|uniref:Brix domain-containing protein n=1 Tax=Tricharina praecox TaxID=43433 RepID=UPI002220A6D7|nr:Brix domain-containing protein [Tricharina praecox]KAI5854764.1 Brix domain-containing protein [Tricharina praecox]